MEIEKLSGRRVTTLVDAELRRMPRAYRGALYGLACLLVAGIATTIMIRVPEVVSAPGLIRPAQEFVPIDAERPGRVVALSVKEGDEVRKGDLLLELHAVDLRQQYDIRKKQLSLLEAQAEELGHLLSMLQGGAKKELSIFSARYASIRAELDVANQKTIVAQRELKRLEELGPETIPKQQVERKRDEVRSAELSHDDLRARHRSKVEAEELATRDEIPKLRMIVLQIEQDLVRSRVVAPVSGKIVFASLREVGALVKHGDRLFQIAPEGTGWILDALVPAARSGTVHTGMDVRIHLKPFPSTEFGTLKGRVTWVAPDAGEGASRRVKVELLEEKVRGREGAGKAEMGMAGEARIVIRERRLLFHLIGGDWGEGWFE